MRERESNTKEKAMLIHLIATFITIFACLWLANELLKWLGDLVENGNLLKVLGFLAAVVFAVIIALSTGKGIALGLIAPLIFLRNALFK
jgi:hypothetical protein